MDIGLAGSRALTALPYHTDAMKVLNLRCSSLHAFEGWFGSEDDFQGQRQNGLVQCPVCADSDIQKMPSAPRLNFGGHAAGQANLPARDATAPAGALFKERLDIDESRALAAPTDVPFHPVGRSEDAALLAAVRQVMAATEDVGRHFAKEARRMYYGETPARSIRGQASQREALEMREEGIEVMALPMLPASAETLQ